MQKVGFLEPTKLSVQVVEYEPDMTTVLIGNLYDEVTAIGTAKCAAFDEWNPEVGRALAMARALSHLAEKYREMSGEPKIFPLNQAELAENEDRETYIKALKDRIADLQAEFFASKEELAKMQAAHRELQQDYSIVDEELKESSTTSLVQKLSEEMDNVMGWIAEAKGESVSAQSPADHYDLKGNSCIQLSRKQKRKLRKGYKKARREAEQQQEYLLYQGSGQKAAQVRKPSKKERKQFRKARKASAKKAQREAKPIKEYTGAI